jgi:hypothetical protein
VANQTSEPYAVSISPRGGMQDRSALHGFLQCNFTAKRLIAGQRRQAAVTVPATRLLYGFTVCVNCDRLIGLLGAGLPIQARHLTLSFVMESKSNHCPVSLVKDGTTSSGTCDPKVSSVRASRADRATSARFRPSLLSHWFVS